MGPSDQMTRWSSAQVTSATSARCTKLLWDLQKTLVAIATDSLLI